MPGSSRVRCIFCLCGSKGFPIHFFLGCIVRTLPRFLAAFGISALLFSAPLSAALAGPVACHYTYGGETFTLLARPTAEPYAVKGVAVGSYFHFRVVLQDVPADLASLKVYTYADRDDGPVLIHQASYPYPPHAGAAAPYGFSGLHFVYEPLRDGELQYWCELAEGAV